MLCCGLLSVVVNQSGLTLEEEGMHLMDRGLPEPHHLLHLRNSIILHILFYYILY